MGRKMNGTGGCLQRSKHVANGFSAKQNQYFATTRARLQGGSRAGSLPYATLFEGTGQEIRLLRNREFLDDSMILDPVTSGCQS